MYKLFIAACVHGVCVLEISIWIVLIAGLRDLDSNLGAYPYESLKRWVSLTNHVSETLVARYHCMIMIVLLSH